MRRLFEALLLGIGAVVAVVAEVGRRLDPVFARAFTPAIHFWCRVTGRSNFALARGAIGIGGLGIVVSGVVSVITDPSPANVVLSVLGTLGWSYITYVVLVIGKRVEQGLEAGDTTLWMTASDAWDLRFYRVLTAVFGVLGLLALSFTPYIPFSLGCYALTHIHGRRKSAFARARDAIRAKLRVPRLAPAPA